MDTCDCTAMFTRNGLFYRLPSGVPVCRA
jgi:hypothetical protein